MPDATKPVVTRFAPSPTGFLHVGGARTALFCWAYARKRQGRFLLRIEDTDAARSSRHYTDAILAELAWLGIDWDDGPEHTTPDGRAIGQQSRDVGPFFQSQRADHYNAAVDRLLDLDLAYPAFETSEQLDAMRAEAQSRKQAFRYIRAVDYDREASLARVRDNEPHVVRFRAPETPITIHDEVLGEVTFEPDHIDDFVIRKRDGMPTYHLAVVVDDHLMGVTHILRGQEHLNNTPRHAALQQALGYTVPVYAHLPLIFNTDGSKMSKRDKDKALRDACRAQGLTDPPTPELDAERFAAWLDDKKAQLPGETLDAAAHALGVHLPEIDVEDFRDAGYLPEVLANFLALLGWNPGLKNPDGTDLERFSHDFLAEHFSLERLGRSASKFDREKLLAFNKDTLAQMDDAEFADRWRRWLDTRHEDHPLDAFQDERFALLARAAKPRAATFAEAVEVVRFAWTPDDEIEFDDKAVAKALHKGDPPGIDHLRAFRAELDAVQPFDPETIESSVKQLCERRGVGMGKLAQPLRVAVTGSAVSPGLGDTLAVLGRDSVARRIDRCLAHTDAR